MRSSPRRPTCSGNTGIATTLGPDGKKPVERRGRAAHRWFADVHQDAQVPGSKRKELSNGGHRDTSSGCTPSSTAPTTPFQGLWRSLRLPHDHRRTTLRLGSSGHCRADHRRSDPGHGGPEARRMRARRSSLSRVADPRPQDGGEGAARVRPGLGKALGNAGLQVGIAGPQGDPRSPQANGTRPLTSARTPWQPERTRSLDTENVPQSGHRRVRRSPPVRPRRSIPRQDQDRLRNPRRLRRRSTTPIVEIQDQARLGAR